MDKNYALNQSHILVTGAAGFIGCNFVRLALQNGILVTAVDKLTYAGRYRSLVQFMRHPRFNFLKCDISHPDLLNFVISTCKNEKGHRNSVYYILGNS